MKKSPEIFLALVVSALALANSFTATARAQGTAFLYQGQLSDNGSPANGSYNMTFALFDSATNVGNLIAGPLTNPAVAVTGGMFVATIDFGAGVFTGSNYWLQIGVTTNGGTNFTALAPRQPLLPTPYAITAGSAGNFTGPVTAAQLPASVVTNGASGVNFSGTFNGNGNGLTNLDYNTITNAPAPVSTANLTLTNDGRAVTLTNPANVFAGSFVLSGDVTGTRLNIGQGHTLTGTFATIAGGQSNTASGSNSIVLGGNNNVSSGSGSLVAGGFLNVASNYTAAVIGGFFNTAGGANSLVGSGFLNTASGVYSTVIGGYDNTASGDFTFASGTEAQAMHNGTFVITDSQFVPFASTAPNQFSARFSGGARFVTAGAGMTVDGPVTAASFIGDGSGLTNLNVSNVTAQLPPGVLTNNATNVTLSGTFLGDGGGLTNLNVGNLNGELSAAQLPATVVTNNETGVTLAGTFSGDGGGLTNLNASTLTSGIVPLAQIPPAVVTNNETNLTLAGTFSGNGSGLTNLNASKLTSGTVPLAQIPAAVVTNNESSLTLSGTFSGTISGNGVGLTNLTTPTIANFAHVYSTSTQVVSSAGTFQDIANQVNGQLNGWSHGAGSTAFTNGQTGLYLVQYTAETTTTTTATTSITLRAVANGTEIADSQATATADTASRVVVISKSFLANFNSGDVLKFQVTGSATTDELIPGTGNGTTKPSFSCTLLRVQ